MISKFLHLIASQVGRREARHGPVKIRVDVGRGTGPTATDRMHRIFTGVPLAERDVPAETHGDKAWLLTLLVSFLLFGYSYAAENQGTTSGILLRMGGNARSYALGEAYGATNDDATVLYFNPASLAHLERGSLDLMHAIHISPIFFDNLALSYPLVYGAVGFGLQYLSYGKLDEIDNTGTNTGSSFSPKDMAAIASYAARLFSPNFSVGLSAKFIQSTIKETASAIAGDVGFVYKINETIPLGIAAQNIGQALKFNKEESPLPLNVRGSTAFRPTELSLVSLDINYPPNGSPSAALGVEAKLNLTTELFFSPRLGVNSRTMDSNLGVLSIFSAGFGLSTRSQSFDYALNSLGNLGLTHRLSLSLKFP